MRKGVGPFGLLLVGLFGSIIVSGIIFMSIYSRTNVTRRALMETNIINGINKVELNKIALSQALEYSFNEASYLVSERGGYTDLGSVDSYDCIPYWREYDSDNYPGMLDIKDLTLIALNNYGFEIEGEVKVPEYTKLNVSNSESKVRITASSDDKLSLERDKVTIKSSDLEENFLSNIPNMYFLGKKNFIDRDLIRGAIQNAIDKLPQECKTINTDYNLCESEIDVETISMLSDKCPDWDSTIRNEIKNNIAQLNLDMGDLGEEVTITATIPDPDEDIFVSYKSNCVWGNTVEDASCGCNKFSLVNYQVVGCEEYNKKVESVICNYEYYASARVLIEIKDNSGKEYPILDDDNTSSFKPMELKFLILSGNDYNNKIDPLTDSKDCEIEVIKPSQSTTTTTLPKTSTSGLMISCPDSGLINYIDDYNTYKDTIYSAIDDEGLVDLLDDRDNAARLVAGIITQESRWNQNTGCSETSGCGLMQITESTASGCEGGWEAIRDDVDANIKCGVRTLKNKSNSMSPFNDYDSDNLIKLTLAAYNGGQGTIQEAIDIAGDSKWESINNMEVMTEACERICEKYGVYCGIESWKAEIILTYVDDTVYPYYQSWLECETEEEEITTTTVEILPSDEISWPIDNFDSAWTSSCYGWRNFGGCNFHTGIDKAISVGTELKAVADGIVILTINSDGIVDPPSGYGNRVMIEHQRTDGTKFYTLYAHIKCNGVVVSTGQVVKEGDLIGYSGGDDNCKGWSSGGHLHFEIREGASTSSSYSVNPCLYLSDCDCSTTCSEYNLKCEEACLVPETPCWNVC